MYAGAVPKLWTETIEEHRRAVHDATLDTTAALVAEHGLASVTMSRIAAETGIGRATLYKYFPDVEAILAAWHERHVARHLEHLAQVRDQAAGTAAGRLEAVLTAYALITYERPQGTELAARGAPRRARRPGRAAAARISSATSSPRARGLASCATTPSPASWPATACTP